MKINTLKFHEISTIVNNKQLSLDLFDNQDKLFTQSSCAKSTIKTARNIDRYKISNKTRSNLLQQSIPNPHEKPTSQIHPPKQDILSYLQQSLINYLECISCEQKKSIRLQLELIAYILCQENTKNIFKQIDQLQQNLSKKIKNRIIHLIFYLVYNELKNYSGQRNIQKQIKNYIFCQYYSRKFNFKKLTLSICIQLQQIYCKVNNYEMSRHYARKSLRLSVVIGNLYFQEKMIDCLYILNYYEGRLNQNTSNTLSKQEKKRILQSYSEDGECPNIFELQNLGKIIIKEFNLENNNNYIQNSKPNQNIRYFQNNYHDIIKAIPGKNINLRNIINKVSSVGTIKKYFSKDNYITLKPQCHIIKPIYQEQVLITHKKENALTQQNISFRKSIKRIRKMLDYTISAYTFHL